ncbi:hypothetical protein ZHAS_00017586 [Anopheles sinensis]|uniref:Uncharacterized protein n=1 Tax=Anopheles sinensis TaxID=74873 RepID=A0A084WH82_ANOSI|nr:hypothetical protein ZHAS_00017586 [Anopheles sinensis]
MGPCLGLWLPTGRKGNKQTGGNKPGAVSNCARKRLKMQRGNSCCKLGIPAMFSKTKDRHPKCPARDRMTPDRFTCGGVRLHNVLQLTTNPKDERREECVLHFPSVSRCSIQFTETEQPVGFRWFRLLEISKGSPAIPPAESPSSANRRARA